MARTGEYEGSYGDWTVRVYYESEVMPWERPGWRWSAMRFKDPRSDSDDRVATLGGECPSAKSARLCAFSAAKRYDAKHPIPEVDRG